MQIVTRHRVQHEWFSRLAQKLNAEPPCCSDAEDWEDAGGWAAELDQLAEQAPVHPPVMPLDPGGRCFGGVLRGRGVLGWLADDSRIFGNWLPAASTHVSEHNSCVRAH